jgi:PAS domain S-box-containing protein
VSDPGAASVLLVDDHPENLLALEAVLAPLGCRTVSVTSGEDALRRLLAEEFALVLLDVQMPGMDGFETAELIKARERTRALPIIFVTAISKERTHVFRGYGAGAVDYVMKPYDPAVLRSKVAVFLELDAKTRAAAEGEALHRAMFEDAPIGMARLDAEGRVQAVNRALGALLGREPRELAGQRFDGLLHPEDAAALAGRRRELLAGRGATEREARLVARDGEEVPCLVSLSLARPGGRAPDVVLAQVQDLRDRRRAEAERERRVREQAARQHAEQVSERLQAVQRIADAALESLAFDDLVRELLGRTTEALAVDTAAIVLAEGPGEATVHQVAGGVDAGVQKRRWAVAPGSLSARVVEGNRPVSAVDVAAEGGGEEHPLGAAVTSVLGVPLVVGGEPIGALHVGTLFPRRFTADDASILTLAAERAGLGLQRLRLFERERSIAQELQRSLLPDALPVLPGYAAAARYHAGGAGTQVGGDWYDALVQRTGELLLVIGDVAGRGVGAAATMGRLRSALRAYAVDGHGPAAILERLNALQFDLGQDDMATAAIVGLDPLSGRMRYASAGHLPPLLVCGGEGRWLAPPRGMPLGTVEDARYSEAEAELPEDATLALYTDGLVEARGEVLDRGLERLLGALLGASGDLEAVCGQVLEGAAGAEAVEDDVTLLLLRREPVAVESLDLRVPGTPLALRVLRSTARGWLAAAGAPDGVAHDVLMAVNEAVQNAIEHGHRYRRTPVCVRLRRDGEAVVVTVRDAGRWRPPRDDERGRGLPLMRGLVDGVDIRTDGHGTEIVLRRALAGAAVARAAGG